MDGYYDGEGYLGTLYNTFRGVVGLDLRKGGIASQCLYC